MPAVKLTIVGGGSAYMTSMFASLARYARQGGLAGSEITLMDINAEAVELMGRWAQAAVEATGLPLTFTHTTDLNAALDGADFVLSSFRTAGLDHRYLDETLPLKHGELGSETVGVGGLFMALRGVPEAVKLAEAIEARCPSAWLISYTNPAHMICEATFRAGHERTIGLCDGVCGVQWLACKLLKIPTTRWGEIEAYVAGVNHLTWTLKLFHQGRDLYAEMDDLIARADLTAPASYEEIDGNPLLNEIEVDACRLYRHFGILPGSIYYARYYYNLRKLMGHLTDPAHEHRSQWLQARAKMKRDYIRKQLESGEASFKAVDEEDASHGDQAIGAIHAVANDTRKLETANVLNRGAVPELPDDAVVEVGCILGAHGAIPVAAGHLPAGVVGMVRDAHDFGRLSVDAALSGDRRLVLQAAMAHPAHRDLDVIEKVIDEMFEAHRAYLPQFFAEA